jgi:glycosyltransferase involved in cell wall biosynthesis
MPDPQVSIVIPFFHTYATYLPACLDSVRQQTYTNWEIIIVDDASPSEEGRVIVEGIGDPRIRIVRHEQNRGQAAGRNTGMRLAQGELLMPLDCDDVLAPTHLEKLVGALQANPECGAAYSDYSLFDAVSRDMEFPVRDTRALLKEQWIPHPGTIVRRSLWEQTRGYCEDELFRAGNEDWDYFLSVAEVGLKAVRIPEPLYFYRQHTTSITSTKFALADYVMRESMYVRHRHLFDRYKMRRPFLSGGYRCSAKAFWQKGDRLQALKLLVRAIWLDPMDVGHATGRTLRRSHVFRMLSALMAG